MKIKLKSDASRIYIDRCNCLPRYKGGPRPTSGKKYNQKYADFLAKYGGRWLEVDIKYIFPDQYNVWAENTIWKIFREEVDEIVTSA